MTLEQMDACLTLMIQGLSQRQAALRVGVKIETARRCLSRKYPAQYAEILAQTTRQRKASRQTPPARPKGTRQTRPRRIRQKTAGGHQNWLFDRSGDPYDYPPEILAKRRTWREMSDTERATLQQKATDVLTRHLGRFVPRPRETDPLTI